LKIEIFDQDGKLVDHGGREQASGTDPRRLGNASEAPAVAPAASALFEAAQGPARSAGPLTR